MNDVTLCESPLEFATDLAEGGRAREADTLNLFPYAQALCDVINGCESPMTIGIEGDLGIGRTSILNMLRGSGDLETSGLLDASLCQVVSLDVGPYSQFNQHEQMVVACLHAISEELGRVLQAAPGVGQDMLRTRLQATQHELAAAMQLIRQQGAESQAENQAETPGSNISWIMQRFSQEFGELVGLWAESGTGKKMVVFIDDLDRVPPSMALELIQAVNNFLNVPGSVYVMALDREVVQRGLLERSASRFNKNDTKALYDKLIQLSFEIPTASYKLDGYVPGLLQKAGLSCLGKDRSGHQFILEITRYTVGRNPRNIKRVVNHTRLLERIHRHNTGRETSEDECRILYALVSMQMAWPELFDHFVCDPSVDRVTSMQSWTFLEKLPEAARLFEGDTDGELLKSSVSAYFDTLFSMLDENDDGQIDSKELQPVLAVMENARIADIEHTERPREWIIGRIRENNSDDNQLIESFLENVFMKSVWYLGAEIRYRRAGHRYVTLVHDRRQIGTIVSLKAQPFVFRLAMSPERVMTALSDYWKSKQSLKDEAIVLVRNTFGSEASLTGFGDTLVDYSKMTYMPSKQAIKLLNLLYEIVTDEPGD